MVCSLGMAQTSPTYQQLKSFRTPPASGQSPVAPLIQGADGALYGTCVSGGPNNSGTVFKVNPDGSGWQVLVAFSFNTTGSSLRGRLLQATNGLIYGTFASGPIGSYGGIFRIHPDGSGFSLLKIFDGIDGVGNPNAGLIQGLDGALYGVSGGTGRVFRINPDGSGYHILAILPIAQVGYDPLTELVQGPDGTFYGMTSDFGSGGGAIFKLNPDGTGLARLINLPVTSALQGDSKGQLIMGNDGVLYGTAWRNGLEGMVFKISVDGTGFTILTTYSNDRSYQHSVGGIMQSQDGSLYFTDSNGVHYPNGAVLRIHPDGTGLTLLMDLETDQIGDHLSAIMQASDGALYLTCGSGGLYNSGTVLTLDPDGTGLSVIRQLSKGVESGRYPECRLIEGPDGMLYGTASEGGGGGAGGGGGTVFKINPNGSGFTVLKSFHTPATEGYIPLAGLLVGSDGALYGTTSQGGVRAAGTVFRLYADGTGYTVLTHLDPVATGARPSAELIQGADGTLYGTAANGGSHGYGTIFKLSTDGTNFTVLKHFDSSTGTNPKGALIQTADGILYGTARNGGSSGSGTVFRLHPDGTGFTVLKELISSSTGGLPSAALIQGVDGALYGTAETGGANGVGTVFKLQTDGTGFTILRHLSGSSSGSSPVAALVQTTNGALYGTTKRGGSRQDGTVFKLNPDGSNFSVVLSFDYRTTGREPFAGLLQGADGNLYGTTRLGDDLENPSSSYGTLFRLLLNPPAPIADAGVDFSSNEGSLATLDGSGSSAAAGGLSYSWVQVPGGTTVTLSDPSAPMPTFTAPFVPLGGETLSFDLTVTANGRSSIDTVSVTVVNVNHPPVAEAGPDQSVAEGSPVTLHGEDSFDIDIDPFTFSWTQVDNGSPAVVLSGATTANPTFAAPFVEAGGAPGVVATLIFELRVDDGYPQDEPAPGYTFANVVDQVVVEVTNVNNNPTARAGADQTVDEGSSVTLDGTASSDPDADSLGHAWVQVANGAPTVALVGADTASPSFVAPNVGAGGVDLEFELTVDDGYGGLATDQVTVHVQNVNDPPLASAAQPTQATLWPPNHSLVAVGITGVSDPNGDPVTITITGVRQDEPTNGLGDGDTAIDAVINNDGTVLLRAERSGTGDGRVYRIYFSASDLEGSASGVVLVKVPRSVKIPAMDSGDNFDSTE